MKALSIHQPFAAAIADGLKLYETRGWPTSYRGPLAIHASKSTMFMKDAAALLAMAGSTNFEMRFDYGAVIATCQLVACVPVEKVRNQISVSDAELGDYSDGRFAWRLAAIKPLTPVLPCRGLQGLFDVDVDALRKQLAAAMAAPVQPSLFPDTPHAPIDPDEPVRRRR